MGRAGCSPFCTMQEGREAAVLSPSLDTRDLTDRPRAVSHILRNRA